MIYDLRKTPYSIRSRRGSVVYIEVHSGVPLEPEDILILGARNSLQGMKFRIKTSSWIGQYWWVSATHEPRNSLKNRIKKFLWPR